MRVFPEWAHHKAIWTAWPSHEKEWPGVMDRVREEVAGMVRALARGERVRLLVYGDEPLATAKAALDGTANVDIVPTRFGDIWVRDTGPIFARDGNDAVALTFKDSSWGGKFDLPYDDEVAGFIAQTSGTRQIDHDFIMEGGSVDFDGDGNLLTTRECLLNANRNPGLSQSDMEERLRALFDVRKIIWLDVGLQNDHTDGHIDNVARFVAPGHAVCHAASGTDDPNAATYETVAKTLEGAGLKVTCLPSPGRMTNQAGDVLPTSHMNFIIGNEVVVVPSYEDVYSAEAVVLLQRLFPSRQVVALPARCLLEVGGGSFHCITQPEFGS